MAHFSYINPCGIADRGVTSVSRLLGREPPMDEMADSLVGQFAEVFAARIEWADEDIRRNGS